VQRLQEAIDVTARAAARLKSSLSDDAADLDRAIGNESTGADKHLLNILDSFVQRFQQVHEHMTHRLFPALFRVEELGERPPPMLKLLSWLEGWNLIENRSAWGRYAEARNRLVHEYPLDPAERAEALRLAVDYSAAMLGDLDRLMEHVRSRDLLAQPKEQNR
jgi:hypothetical protein